MSPQLHSAEGTHQGSHIQFKQKGTPETENVAQYIEVGVELHNSASGTRQLLAIVPPLLGLTSPASQQPQRFPYSLYCITIPGMSSQSSAQLR